MIADIHIVRNAEYHSRHTVEELQGFSNTRTPSPPWVHVVRLIVPMSCCDDAATYLIQALGGDEMTKKVVGGTKWWQVRGIKGYERSLRITMSVVEPIRVALTPNGSHRRRIGRRLRRKLRHTRRKDRAG